MDDNQCRVCLGEANDNRLSVFKRVNGVAVEEKLQFIAGLKITKHDNFSKLLCKKCFNDLNISYAFKTKCLDTDRTLKNLDKKFQVKLQETVQQIFMQSSEIKEEDEMEIEEEVFSEEKSDLVEPDEFVEQEDEEETQFVEIVEYENVEFLEPDVPEAQKIEPVLEFVKARKFFCILCNPNVSFNREIALRIHKWEIHKTGEGNPLICPTCNYTFESKGLREESLARQIQKHFAAHESGKMNACIFCPEVFKSHHNLEDHLYRQHQNPHKQNRCKACQNDFESYQELQAHLMDSSCKNEHERPFKCYICNVTFTMGIAKKKHVQTEHHDKAGSDCPLCLRCKIPSAVAFENHYKTHFADPRFCCSFCGRPFYESDRLQTHIRRAHENTKLICNWCGRSFRDKSGIARHILGVHFNQRNHRCHLCPKTFTASYNLKEHLFSVHKKASKYYTCELCTQDFLYRKQFERHRMTCNGMPDKRRR